MGTFAGFYGEQKIKEELKEAYTKNLIKLLNAGGMMQFESVNLFGKEIGLLKELTPNEDGVVHFHYNYFGDEAWETAGLNLNTCKFYSGKIGWGEFCDVILAAYVLTEFYTEEFGVAEINGEIFDAKESIGWINYVLDKEFTNIRAVDAIKLWEAGQEYNQRDIPTIVQECGCNAAINLTNLMEYFYITKNENTMWEMLVNALGESETNNIVITKVILKMEKAIEKLVEKGKTYEEILEYTFGIEEYFNNRKNNDDEQNEPEKYRFYMLGLLCPKVIVLVILCEMFEKDFAEEYKLYKEKLVSSADEFFGIGDISKLESIEKIKTYEYLDTPDSALCFRHTEAKENYHKSDDDFALFWTPDCDLKFSDNFNIWCDSLKKDFEEILKHVEMVPNQMFIKNLIETLKYADDTYKRIFAPSTMFYEFISNSENKNYQAAYKLFVKLLEDNLEEGKVIEKVNSWDIADKNITFNKGRLNIKRYLAIMGNIELRKQLFGF